MEIPSKHEEAEELSGPPKKKVRICGTCWGSGHYSKSPICPGPASDADKVSRITERKEVHPPECEKCKSYDLWTVDGPIIYTLRDPSRAIYCGNCCFDNPRTKCPESLVGIFVSLRQATGAAQGTENKKYSANVK